MATQTILSNKQSTNGSPYAIYTVSVNPYGRSSNSVNMTVTVTTSLKNADSWLGTGHILIGTITLNGMSFTIDIKGYSDSWSGTSAHTATKDITITNLTSAQTSITGVTFAVQNTYGSSSTLTSTSCSNITISAGNSASGFSIYSPCYVGTTYPMTIYAVDSSNYHKIVATYSSKSYTFSTNAKSTLNCNFASSTFLSWFSSTTNSITVRITVTTYNSSGTSLGSAYKDISLCLSEENFKPGLPSATKLSETLTGATFELTRPSFNGSSFSKWEVTGTNGTVSVSTNTVTGTIDAALQKTEVVKVVCVDSRGFRSDPIYLRYHIRQKGFYVYNNAWLHCVPSYYNSGYKQAFGAVYANSKWNR